MSDNLSSGSTILRLQNVKKYFPVKRDLLQQLMRVGEQQYVHAVDDVSFEIEQGKVFGLVGESGSGKSTTGRLAVGLLEPTEGEVIFEDIHLNKLSGEELRKMRRYMQVIFQDPMASMNPRMTLGEGVGHGLKIHHLVNNQHEFRHRVSEILDKVGLTPGDAYFDRYPHQISGGQRQRAVIARALVMQPKLILADEPIAMADVSVKAVLLDLMVQLQREFGLTYLFITHDLATAKYICDRIAIMYLGEIIEVGDIKTVYTNPKHPYTEALLAAVPVPDPRFRRPAPMPRGEIPNAINPPSGCRFHPRCPIAQDICKTEHPRLLPVPDQPGHVAACHFRTGDYIHLDPGPLINTNVAVPK
ncbi:MAG: ABC transporter ATP-binding protein [Chloroflexi bacterium]|nr:ABC transporter ATP-binding protein [Chloroflexota bacterium]